MDPASRHVEPFDADGDLDREVETFNPWSVVNLVFHHLADQGLHPVLGSAGYPGTPAAELLRCLGIRPEAEGNRYVREDVRRQLDDIRRAMFEDPASDH